MPTFAFSATDNMGNTVAGEVEAGDFGQATDEVRGMGYTPVSVTPARPNPPTPFPDSHRFARREGGADAPLPTGSPAQNFEGANDDNVSIPAPGKFGLADSGFDVALAPPSRQSEASELGKGAGGLGSIEGAATRLDATQPLYEVSIPPRTLLGATEEPAETSNAPLEAWERGGPLPVPQVTQPPNAYQSAPATVYAGAANVTQPLPAGAGGTMPRLPSVMPPGMHAREGQAVSREGSRGSVEGKREVSALRQFQEKIIFPIFSGVVLKEVAPYFRQLATLINAGLPLYQALVALEGNTQNKKLKEVAQQAYRRVQNGGRLSDTLAEYPWIFSEMQVQLIRAAETGGMLDVVLRQVGDYVESEIAIRRIISAETLYPKITLFFALMILGRPGFFAGMPAFSNFIVGTMGKSAYTFGDYLRDTVGFGLMIAVPIIAVAIFCRLVLFNIPSVRESYDSFKMAIPGLGPVVRMFALAKFCRTFAALYRGGFGMGPALAIAGDACGNGVIRNSAYAAIPEAERGNSVSSALARGRGFTPMAIGMFQTGETAGNLDGMLDRVADHYEAEGKLKSHQVALLFGVAVFILVAFLVGKAIIEQYMASATRSTTLPDE